MTSLAANWPTINTGRQEDVPGIRATGDVTGLRQASGAVVWRDESRPLFPDTPKPIGVRNVTIRHKSDESGYSKGV
jgi:hypothetical protein